MTATSFLVVATGLLAEARLLAHADVRVIPSGGDPVRLESELLKACAQGARAVFSFGLAAGLDPALAPGTRIIPHEIIAGPDRFATDDAWSERLRAALPDSSTQPVAGVDGPLIRAGDKRALHHATGAAAADMESHVAARVARRAGRPFAVLRVIADPADRALPPAAVVGMRSDGRVDLAAVLWSLLRQPGQLSQLARVATDVRYAMHELHLCRARLGPMLACPPP